MKLTTILTTIFFYFSASALVVGQNKTEACGKVSAFNKFPLKGVEVMAKRSKSMTATDENGKYCVPVFKNDRLTVKAVGFETSSQKVDAGGEKNINLVFKPGQKSFESVVDRGYMDAGDLKFAVNELLAENNNFSEYTTIFTLITSRFSGVEVRTDNFGNGIVIIRGPSSFLNDPGALYVVNGVVVPSIQEISPADVASIEIVKDGGATIYGIRGANGAVVIKTKSK